MSPQVRRDPYLRPVAERWGHQAVLDAGWFDDGDPSDAPLDDVGWLCTPLDAVQRGVVGELPRPPVVLLSTGGFFPVHDGHLAMMVAARHAVEGAGRQVVGGYLSPAHDDYIRLKCGTVDVPVSERIARAEAVVAPTGWLSIDPWEALARRVSVNFTDVTARLETYLRHHVRRDLEVIYVCGGDNARFALAFTERGGCVVVARPGSEATVERWQRDPRVVDHPRIIWADGDDASSSTSIRAQARHPSPTGAARRVTTSASPAPGDERPRLTLRLEDERAVTTIELPAEVWRRFQDGLRTELATRVALETVTLEDQRLDAKVAGTVSLDPMLPAEIDLGISRLFDLGGNRPIGHTARPGSPTLEGQLAAIPPGTWTLRDDDTSTGATIRYVADHLPDGVILTATTFALEPASVGDVADSRDFLLGADDGGLVVALPGPSIGRAPYLLPYVDPTVRAGLPGADAIAFSLALWDLNAASFAGTGLRVDDLPTATARTMERAGHPGDALLDDVCRRHAEVLRSFLA